MGALGFKESGGDFREIVDADDDRPPKLMSFRPQAVPLIIKAPMLRQHWKDCELFFESLFGSSGSWTSDNIGPVMLAEPSPMMLLSFFIFESL